MLMIQIWRSAPLERLKRRNGLRQGSMLHLRKRMRDLARMHESLVVERAS
jgi:hypothetical protein